MPQGHGGYVAGMNKLMTRIFMVPVLGLPELRGLRLGRSGQTTHYAGGRGTAQAGN